MIVKRWAVSFGAASVAVVGAGTSYLVIDNGSDAVQTNVLGERISGSGSSVVSPTTDGSHGSSGSGTLSTVPSPSATGPARTSTGGNTGNDKKNFTISGQVGGLFPGADRPLVLTFSNPNGSGINVDSLTVQADASPSRCPSSTLTFSGFTPTVVPGKGSATATVTAHMDVNAGNSCAGTTWVLAYSGTAVQV